MTHPTPLPAVDADVAAIREALQDVTFFGDGGFSVDTRNWAKAANPLALQRILTALTAAQARAEAAEKDARRYRWLRDSQESDWAICEWANDHDGTGFYRDARNADIVEAAIDAAMAADSAIGGKGE